MLRGLKIVGTIMFVPFALAAFLVLMIAAVLWYYLNTLAYLGRAIVRTVTGRSAPEPRMSGPHFAERATRKIPVD